MGASWSSQHKSWMFFCWVPPLPHLMEVPGAQETLLKRVSRWVPLGSLVEEYQSWREAPAFQTGRGLRRGRTGTFRLAGLIQAEELGSALVRLLCAWMALLSLCSTFLPGLPSAQVSYGLCDVHGTQAACVTDGSGDPGRG